MSDAHATPFIPPMAPLSASPQPNSRNGPPQLPTHQPNEPLPAWASTAQHAASYPAWPHSTPYGPPPPHMTPMSGPTMYIPGNYQPTAPPVIPPAPGGRSPYFLPNGLSSDYTGYPDSPSAFNGRQAPGTPAPPSAPVIPPPPASAGPVFPPPSVGPPHMSGGTPYNPHQPPLPGAYYNGPPSAPAGYGWGPPPGPAGYVPFGQPYSAGPYGGGMYSTPWQPPNMSFGPPSAGMMPGGWPGGPMTGPPPPHSQLPPGPPPQAYNPIPIPTIYEGDRVGKFMAGPHYGPVLDSTVLPFLVSKLQLNPLIEPVPESGPDADRPHLKWSMLFPASHCQRSTDPTHVSWSKGRSEPATWPRVDRIRILSKTFPWTIEVIASNPDEGVTCGDIIERIGEEMYKITPGGEFKSLNAAMQAAVGKSYHFNRSRAHGVPGGRLGDGLRKLDFLGQEAVFGGIVDDPGYIKQIVGAVLPATFLLRCVRQYALTAEELREHEEQQRRIDEEAEAASARSAKSGRSRSRAPSRAPSDNGLT